MTYDEMKNSLSTPLNPYSVQTLEEPKQDQAMPLYNQKQSSQAPKEQGVNWGQVAGTAAGIIGAIVSDEKMKAKIKGLDIKSMTQPKKVSDDPIENSKENPEHNTTAMTALLIEGYKDLNNQLDEILSKLEANK